MKLLHSNSNSQETLQFPTVAEMLIWQSSLIAGLIIKIYKNHIVSEVSYTGCHLSGSLY